MARAPLGTGELGMLSAVRGGRCSTARVPGTGRNRPGLRLYCRFMAVWRPPSSAVSPHLWTAAPCLGRPVPCRALAVPGRADPCRADPCRAEPDGTRGAPDTWLRSALSKVRARSLLMGCFGAFSEIIFLVTFWCFGQSWPDCSFTLFNFLKFA